MKKLLGIVVLGLLLSGCASNEYREVMDIDKYIDGNKFPKEDRLYHVMKSFKEKNYENSILYTDDGEFVRPKEFNKELNYNVHNDLMFDFEQVKKTYEHFKFYAKAIIETNDKNYLFRIHGSTEKDAEDKLISLCKDFKQKNNLSMNCFSSNLRIKHTSVGKLLDNYEDIYLYAKQKIKEEKELKIEQAKIDKKNQLKYKAQKLADNKNRCEEIGFTPQTESFAKCVLKLIELAEIRQSALIESNSRASLEAEMQQQQIDIQDQIAAEAKASRDQQAWGVLLGMTMGSGILDTSSGGLFSPSTVSCNKTGESTSGTNKICYYNCMGSTKTINVGSMQFCPININK